MLQFEIYIGIVLSYINIVLQTLSNFIYIPLLLYHIGKSEYGLYQLIGSMIAYFSVMDFGLSAMVVRFYTKYRMIGDSIGMENILAVARRCYFGITCVMLLIGGGLYPFLNDIFGNNMSIKEIDEGEKIYILLLINLAITLMGMVYKAVIDSYQRYVFLRGLSAIQIIMQPVMVALLLRKYPCAFSVALVQTIINSLLICIQIYYANNKLCIHIRFHYWTRQLMMEVGRFSLAMIVVAIVDQLFFQTNQIILGIIDGTAAVAVYAVAANVQKAYMMLSTSVTGVYLPHITEMIARKATTDDISQLFIKIGRIQFFILAMISIGFAIFGKEFIYFWAGDGFEDAYWIALLTMIPFTTDLVQNIGFSILQAMNRFYVRAIILSAVGLLNLVLAVPLGMKYGGVGCAMATGFAMFLGNGIGMSFYYGHVLKLHVLTFWYQISEIILKLAGLFVFWYAVNLQINELVFGGEILLVKLLIYVLTYLFIIYRWCFNREEKIVVNDTINQLVKKLKTGRD